MMPLRSQVPIWPPFDCGYNISSVFKAFSVLFVSAPCVCYPVASLRSRQCSISYFFSKSMVYCLGLKSYMHSSVVSSVVHKLIYKDYFPIFSLFVIVLVLSDSLGILWLEVWDFIYPVLPFISLPECNHVWSQTVE